MARHRALGLFVVLVVLTLSRPVVSAERATRQNGPPAVELDLFDAIKTGEIDARFIPRDAASGTVLITNKTDRPLAIRLPEAFAGVPIQAQIGGNGLAGVGANNPNGGNGGNAGNQSVGGGFGGAGLGGLGGAGGLFSIDSGRARKLKVVSVCLDHGKRDPAPRVPYELVPLNHRTGDGQLVELVKMLGRGQVDQSAAQAAAWHLASGLSWQELASKARVKHIGGAQEPLFTAAQLDLARQITEVASRQAEKPAPSTSASGE